MHQKRKVRVKVYRSPSSLPALHRDQLLKDLRRIAGACFDTIPEYQCLIEDGSGLKDKVISVAYDTRGVALGFSSAALLEVSQVGEALHLGLTCVHPERRGLGLTHKLSSQLLVKYMLTRSPIKPLWVSNVACVMSSLGNVALHFEDVYPSPFLAEPSETHQKIADTISQNYRELIAINDDAHFDRERFVFKNSVLDSPFQKSESDQQYFHRDQALNSFYLDLLELERGDEACQVGKISWAQFLKYAVNPKRVLKRKSGRSARAVAHP